LAQAVIDDALAMTGVEEIVRSPQAVKVGNSGSTGETESSGKGDQTDIHA
jgi:hypothetical protein